MKDFFVGGAAAVNSDKESGGRNKRGRMFLRTLPFLALFLLAGCSGGGEKPDGPDDAGVLKEPRYDWNAGEGHTLEVWSQSPDIERTYMKRAFERYEELTGNRIDIRQIPQDSFESEVAAALRKDEGHPDLILSYGGTNIESFDPERNLCDFTDAVWMEDLTDTALNQSVYHGKVIGLPHWEASISGMLYNKKIFEKYHIELPQTQAEFMEACETLLQNGVVPLYLPAKQVSMLLYQFPLDSLVEDAGVLDGLNDGTLGYEDLPGMETVVEWYKTMADRGYLGENFQENDWDGMNAAMRDGGYAMMLCWDTWLYTDFDGNPEDFGLMPAFMGIPDRGTYEGPNLALMLVNKNSRQLDAAVGLVTFMADPYNYNVAFEGIYTAPVFKSQVYSISTPQYAEAERLIEKNYRDSISWLRIRGFSQMDASCILDYMLGKENSAKACLNNMDRLREQRLSEKK